ncbi:uncharacterized protein LOC120339680 isoform X1 [Styela clava]
MAESGTDYMCNKHGLLKMFVIIFGIISFSLVASSGFRGPLGWPFAAFLISWIISLTIYSTMTCVDDIGSLLRKDDFCCSLILFTFCMSATMLLSVYTCAKGPDCGERNAAIWFGFVTAGLYFVEIYMHKKNSPKPKYMATGGVFVLGIVTFSLLANGGYQCKSSQACTSGRTFALVAYIICWSVSTIFTILQIYFKYDDDENEDLNAAEYHWSSFAFIFCLIASIVLACNLQSDTTSWSGSRRVTADVFGFITSTAYLVQAVLLKRSNENVGD